MLKDQPHRFSYKRMLGKFPRTSKEELRNHFDFSAVNISNASMNIQKTDREVAPFSPLGSTKKTAHAHNSGFTRRTLRVLGLRQPEVRSLRLLRGRSASVAPSLLVRKPAAVIRNGGAGGGRPSWPPQKQGCCVRLRIEGAKDRSGYSMVS